MEFNVNNYVRVRLTETGREKLRQWHKDLMGTMDGYREPKEDADGWSRWQMWSLMQQLGWALGNGITAPFETTIIIETPNDRTVGPDAGLLRQVPHE